MAMSDDDLRQIVDTKIRLRRHIDVVRRRTSGRMTPEGLAWGEAADFAADARDAERWIGLLVAEVKRLQQVEVAHT